VRFSLVDSFTRVPYAGNPAGVCLLDGEASAGAMQAFAREVGYSETAFLLPRGDGYDLRWFTPTVEVDLCGHATLASAHVLWESGAAPADRELRFDTRSGALVARRRGEEIELDFPAEPAARTPPDLALASALGIEPLWTGKNRLDSLFLVSSEEELRALRPDFPAVAAACGTGRGAIVTAPSDSPDFDFVSRYFAPAAGIDEDPVTGSTHCCLGPFWAERLKKREFRARQASARGGSLSVRLGEGDRVFLGGSAVTVFRGDLAVRLSE